MKITTLVRPAGPEELDELNRHIVGPIKVIQTFTKP
jgi:hypothetical protein